MTGRTKILLIGITLALFLAVVGGTCFADPDEYWPMFNRDLWNTGVTDPTLGGIVFPIELWSTTTDNQIGSGSPVVADIDGDGIPDVGIPTAGFAGTGGVYVFDKDGTLVWKYATGDYGTYATPPVADIDGDGKLEMIFPSYAGKIVAVDDDGSQMWAVDKGSGGTRSVIADLTVNPGLEVVAGAASKTFLLKVSDGTELWHTDDRMLCDPVIADINGDGTTEILFSRSGKTVVALNAEDGSVAWTSAAMGQDAQNNIAVLNDVNGDGKPDVVVGARDKKLYVFSGADGTKLWDYTVIGRSFSAAVADFNGDGFDDVVTTATKADGVTSYVYVLDAKNQVLLWQANIVGKKSYSTERSPSIADVDGDGTPDVLVAGLSQKLYALSGLDGSVIWTIDTADPSAGVPAICDLDGDGMMEIVVSAGAYVQVFTGLDVTVVYVDDAWAIYDPVADYGTEIEPGKYFGGNAFASIQQGLDAVADTSTLNTDPPSPSGNTTVNVEPGIYAGNLIIYEDGLTLISTGGAAQTIIDASQVDKSGYTNAWGHGIDYSWAEAWDPGLLRNGILVWSDNVTIDGFTILNASWPAAYNRGIGVLIGSIHTTYAGFIPWNIDQWGGLISPVDEPTPTGVTVRNMVIDGASDGIYIWSSSGNTIENNTIRNTNPLGGTGIQIYEGGTNNLIQGNIIENTADAISVCGAWPDHFLDVGGTQVLGNELTGNYAGIKFYNVADPAGQGVVANLNVIRGNTYGLIVAGGQAAVPTAHYNSITGNTTGAFNDDASADFDAALNWWGDADGPSGEGAGAGDSVSTHVIFSPWLGIDPDGNPTLPGVQITGPMLIIVAPVGPEPASGYLNAAIAGANSVYLPGTDTIEVRHGTYTATQPITDGANIFSEPGSAAHTTLSGNMTLGAPYIVLGQRGQGFTVLGSITIPVGTDASTIQANWNNLLGALVNNGTGAVDATLNYWGDPNGPSAGDAVGAVAYSPWLGLAADDSPMLFVVAPVGSEPAGGYLNTAIAAANDLPGTDTIEVQHGTYNAATPITQPVNIVSEPGSAAHTTLNGNVSINGNGVLVGLPLQGFRMNGNVTVGADANAGTSSINWCDLYGSMTNNGTGTFDAQYNYWGTLLESIVDARTTGLIDYDPFLPKNADDSYVDATAIIAAGLAAGIDPAIDQLWLMVQLGQDVSTFIGYAGVAGAGAFGGAPAGGEINLGGAAGGGGAVEGAISGTYTPGEPINGRFTITDPVTGEPITDAAVTTSLLGPDGALVFWGCATYDETTGEYVFTIDTSGLAPGTYELIIQTDDGQSKTVSIEVLAA